MTYIYDIILNFTDLNLFYEYYEWKNTDNLINVRKAPIIKVSKDVFNDFINYKVKVSKTFLNKIKNQSLLFRKDKNDISYLVIISNKEKSIGISFNEEGYIEYKSALLIDEEDEANRIVAKMLETSIKYLKCSKINNINMLRDDIIKKDILFKEIKKLYKNKRFSHLKYYYYELFDEIENDEDKIYSKFIECLNSDATDYNLFYKVICKNYKKLLSK